MGDLKSAVLGLGLGAHFARALAEHPDVGRVVVCDSDVIRARTFAKETPGVDAGYRELEQMLDRERPDLVCVVTPDPLHRPHSTACFEAGCHVLQTKPLATNLDDARAIVKAGRDARRMLMVAHERRFRSRVIRIKELLDDGVLGEIIHLRVDAIQDKRGQFARSPWYASTEAGRSAINGTGIHEVDLVRHFVGREVVKVAAFANRLGDLDFPKDKTTAAIMQFDNNVVGQVTVTYEARGARGRADDHFRLIGTKGMIVGDRLGLDGGETWEPLPGDAREIETGIAGAVAAFVNAVRDGTGVPVTGEDAFATLAVAVAADTSAARGTIEKPEAF